MTARTILLVFIVLFGFGAQAQPRPQIEDCENIIGDWQGTYRANATSFLSEDYSFRGAYDESGIVMIDFAFFDTGERDRHEGYWYCQDGVLTTALVNPVGTPILFQYRILEIGQMTWRYQLLSVRPDAPVFEASRSSPSAMTPQLLDRYPRSFFDELLPPGIGY